MNKTTRNKNIKFVKTELILEYIKTHNLSKTKFAKLCGLSYSTLIKLLDGNMNLGIDVLFKVAKGMGIKTHLLVNENLFKKNQG